MKILFVASQVESINSSAAIRNSALINGLQELGHEVHVETVEYPAQFTSSYLCDNLKARTVRRTYLPIYKYNQSVVSKGLVRKSTFITEILKKVRSFVFFPDISVTWLKYFDFSKVEADYDLIISSSDSKVSHLLAEKIHKNLSIRWIQIWGDPWYDDCTISKTLKLRTWRHERRLLSKADKVIYVSKATHAKQRKLFPASAAKMHYVPRGFLTPVETENAIKDNQISISYTGNLFWGRNITPLIESIRSFNETSEVKVALNIYGVKDERFLEATKDDKFIHSHAPIDYEQILKVYDESNLLLFISNSSTSTQIPGKFFDYSGTTRPVLCLMADDECEIAKYLKSFDRCLVINNEQQTIVDSMPAMISMASKTYAIPAEFYPIKVAEQVIE